MYPQHNNNIKKKSRKDHVGFKRDLLKVTFLDIMVDYGCYCDVVLKSTLISPVQGQIKQVPLNMIHGFCSSPDKMHNLNLIKRKHQNPN
jgi:hypothetical protein